MLLVFLLLYDQSGNVEGGGKSGGEGSSGGRDKKGETTPYLLRTPGSNSRGKRALAREGAPRAQGPPALPSPPARPSTPKVSGVAQTLPWAGLAHHSDLALTAEAMP